jgi:Tol biopolymer transport system component
MKYMFFLLIFLASLFVAISITGCDVGNGSADGGTDEDIDTVECVTDEVPHQVPPLEKPGYLESVTDPVFGFTITRITGDPGTTVPVVNGRWGKRERHHYSKDQAWNSDMSLLYLQERGGGNPLFLDGNTYKVLYSWPEQSGDAARWHPTDPEIMIYVGEHNIQTLNVTTGQRTVLASFSGYSDFTIGLYEGNLSHDGTKLVISATTSGANVVFAYDLATKTKYPDINASGIDWASISPKGTSIVLYGDDQTTRIYDLQGVLLHTWTEAAVPDHYDLGIDLDGREVAVGSARDDTYDGQILKRRLTDGVVTLLEDGGYGSHTSMRAVARSGWSYASFFETDSYSPYSAEIAAVSLDGSRTVRIAHHRSTASEFYREAHPSPSPDGSKIVFASDWGNPSGPIQAYVVEVPPTCTP